MYQPTRLSTQSKKKDTVAERAISNAILSSLVKRISAVKNAEQLAKFEEAENIQEHYQLVKDCMVEDDIERLRDEFRDVLQVELLEEKSRQTGTDSSKKRKPPSDKVGILEKKKFLADQKLKKVEEKIENTTIPNSYSSVMELTQESARLEQALENEKEKKKQKLNNEKKQEEAKKEKILTLKEKHPIEFQFYSSTDMIKASCDYLAQSDLLVKIPNFNDVLKLKCINLDVLRECIHTVAMLIGELNNNKRTTPLPVTECKGPLGLLANHLGPENISLENLWNKVYESLKEESKSGRSETREIGMACFCKAMLLIKEGGQFQILKTMLNTYNQQAKEAKEKPPTSVALSMNS